MVQPRPLGDGQLVLLVDEFGGFGEGEGGGRGEGWESGFDYFDLKVEGFVVMTNVV